MTFSESQMKIRFSDSQMKIRFSESQIEMFFFSESQIKMAPNLEGAVVVFSLLISLFAGYTSSFNNVDHRLVFQGGGGVDITPPRY